MSSIFINYKTEFSEVKANKDFISEIIQSTARILGKDENEVIVSFINYEAINAPSILIRCETSPYRRNLLKEWALEILNTVQNHFTVDKGKFAVKAYVIDSEWIDTN